MTGRPSPELGAATTPLVLVAHGTRDPDGPRVLESLRRKVAASLPGVPVQLAHVDLIGPRLVDVLRGAPRAVVVPLFLSSGYHVRVDVPRALAATGGEATITTPVGPSDAVLGAVADRLRAAGPPPAAVVLAAAGSSDPLARAEVEAEADRLGRLLGRPTFVGFVASAIATLDDAVASARGVGAATVGVASYLLAPGLFQHRLRHCTADLVGEPVGAHPRLVELVASRYLAASTGPHGRRVSLPPTGVR